MKERGSITVEAIIVLPLYMLVIVFLIGFLNIFYIRLAIHQGLNNAATVLAQYCYVVDRAVGLDNLTLSDETSAKAEELSVAVTNFQDSTMNAMTIFNEGISIDRLSELISAGSDFVSATGNLATKMNNIDGQNVVNYLMTTAVETGGGTLVEAMVDNYLDDLKINRNLIRDDIKYGLQVDGTDGRYDLVLSADYVYYNSAFSIFFDGFHIHQQVVVHPWIGGATEGLR